MYLPQTRSAVRAFGDVFDLVGGFFESDLGGAVLKVGTGVLTTVLQKELGPNQRPGQQTQFSTLYAPYSAQPGILPQNVAATTATAQQQAAAGVSSTAQDLTPKDYTPWLVAGAVVLAVLVLK